MAQTPSMEANTDAIAHGRAVFNYLIQLNEQAYQSPLNLERRTVMKTTDKSMLALKASHDEYLRLYSYHMALEKHRRNSITPINTVPTEVLADILQLVVDLVPVIHRLSRVVSLSGVCRHWKRITEGAPHFWNKISCKTSLELVGKALCFSGTLPLQLLGQDVYSRPSESLPRTIRMALGRFSRVERLDLSSYDLGDLYDLIETPLASLNSLLLRQAVPGRRILTIQAPSLRSLSLRSIPVTWYMISNLQCLRLENLDRARAPAVGQFLDILSRSPNLASVICINVNFPPTPNPTVFNNIHLPLLAHFQFLGGDWRAAYAILASIRVSTLASFLLEVEAEGDAPIPVSAIFNNSTGHLNTEIVRMAAGLDLELTLSATGLQLETPEDAIVTLALTFNNFDPHEIWMGLDNVKDPVFRLINIKSVVLTSTFDPSRIGVTNSMLRCPPSVKSLIVRSGVGADQLLISMASPIYTPSMVPFWLLPTVESFRIETDDYDPQYLLFALKCRYTDVFLSNDHALPKPLLHLEAVLPPTWDENIFEPLLAKMPGCTFNIRKILYASPFSAEGGPSEDTIPALEVGPPQTAVFLGV